MCFAATSLIASCTIFPVSDSAEPRANANNGFVAEAAALLSCERLSLNWNAIHKIINDICIKQHQTDQYHPFGRQCLVATHSSSLVNDIEPAENNFCIFE
jgi:hypothetical protein